MSDQSQSDVIAFLSDGSNLPGHAAVEVIRTHGAVVFLSGPHAYKIKCDVRYDYLDFSTLEKRHDMLVRELELNAPTAPSIYRDVVAVTRDTDGDLSLGARARSWNGCFGCAVSMPRMSWTRWPSAARWMTGWRRF